MSRNGKTSEVVAHIGKLGAQARARPPLNHVVSAVADSPHSVLAFLQIYRGPTITHARRLLNVLHEQMFHDSSYQSYTSIAAL